MKKNFKYLSGMAAALMVLSAVNARAASDSFSYFVNAAVPDDSVLGIQDTRTISDPSGLLTGVSVQLQLTPLGQEGGWLGDLYAYVRHTDSSGTATSILLNRIGRTSGNSAGLSDSPVLNITLTGLASDPDIHLLSGPLGANLTGTFSADGRLIDPSLALDTTPRLAGLDVLNGMEASGEWTLFVADISGGNQYRLDSWTLNLDTEEIETPPEAVPEATNVALMAFVLAGLGWATRRARLQRLAK
jgi:hypothetical protein